MLDDATKQAGDDLLEVLQPLNARVRAMFGGLTFYVDDKVAGVVCDGRVFVKRSSREELLDGFAELAPAYPGAKDSWRLPMDALDRSPEKVRDAIAAVAAVLPPRRAR